MSATVAVDAEVLDLVADLAGIPIEQVSPGFLLEGPELSFDEIDQVELVMCLEEDHHIEITDETIEGLKTVQDVINLCNHLKGNTPWKS